jgi:Uncharacterized protein conserved in bacteria
LSTALVNDRRAGQADSANAYVALLRGINVGGKNAIRMPALKACFEAQGFHDVATFIQSGNVVFMAAASDRLFLTTTIESALSSAFGYPIRVVVRSASEMRAIVDVAPKGFGQRPSTYRYTVIFLKEPLTADEAMRSITTKPGVDRVSPGAGVLYCSRLESKATQSRLGRVVGTPAYQNMTIRNWTTTKTLADLVARTPGTS